MRLFNCSANYETFKGYAIPSNPQQKKQKINNGIVLCSYSSNVAIFDKDTKTLYLLPRYNYSHTTNYHLRKFCELFNITYNNLKELEKNSVLCYGYTYNGTFISAY